MSNLNLKAIRDLIDEAYQNCDSVEEYNELIADLSHVTDHVTDVVDTCNEAISDIEEDEENEDEYEEGDDCELCGGCECDCEENDEEIAGTGDDEEEDE